jgi:phosphoglycerol transferase MdoB-like AlkP superfamily enzyme
MLDLSPTFAVELLALAVLGAGLRVDGTFRWSSLFCTAGIRLALLPILALTLAMATASLPLYLALWFLMPAFAAVVGCRLANHFPGKVLQFRG